VGAGVFRSDANLKGITTPDYIPISHYLYKKNDIQPVFPYGIGYQYYVNTNILIGFEAFGRYPLSDFIDGFKPPQNISKNNDVMGGVSLTVSFLLGSEYLKRY
jgi:hypothetical protein